MPQRRLVKKLPNSELVTYGVYPNNKQLFVVDPFISSTLSIEYVHMMYSKILLYCMWSRLIVRVRMRMNLEPRIA